MPSMLSATTIYIEVTARRSHCRLPRPTVYAINNRSSVNSHKTSPRSKYTHHTIKIYIHYIINQRTAATAAPDPTTRRAHAMSVTELPVPRQIPVSSSSISLIATTSTPPVRNYSFVYFASLLTTTSATLTDAASEGGR